VVITEGGLLRRGGDALIGSMASEHGNQAKKA